MPTWSYTIPDIHQGPARIWYDVAVPASGTRLLIDADGNPTAGTPIFLGSAEGPTKITMTRTLEEVMADQETAPIDIRLTKEEGIINCTMLESAMQKLAKAFGPTYAAGTDSGLPAGAQAYQQLTMGGLVVIPTAAVAVISPRLGTASPAKHLVFVLYKAYGVSKLDLSVSLSKRMSYVTEFKGLTIASRPIGDKVSNLYIQD